MLDIIYFKIHSYSCQLAIQNLKFQFNKKYAGNHTGRKVDHDSVKAVVTFDSNEGFTVTIRCSNNSSEYKSTTTDFSPNDTGKLSNGSIFV